MLSNRLNSTFAAPYSAISDCYCNPTANTLHSRTFTSGYVVGGANTYRISATTYAGLSPSSAIGNNYARVTVTYNSGTQPTVSSFTPGSGCSGVTPVTITGTNFTGATAVKIGGTDVSSFTVNSATQITATVGSGTTGTISVTTPSGTGTSAGTFTVNTAPFITACPAAPVTANTASGLCTAAVSYTVTATGTPAPTLTYTFTGATTGSGSGTGSGASFNKGNTTVTVTATNTCGTATCVFTVTVNDNQAPNIGSAGLTDPPSLALNNVSEALGYKVVYQLNIPAGSDYNNTSIPYTVNNSGASGITYDRVAYFMELDNKWIWVSMDKFNTTLTELGIPNAANNNVAWQQIVNNMNIVASSNSGVPNATGVSGNIEMWHNCYSQANALGGIGGNGSIYDFNDTRVVAQPSCFGSFQVHRYGTSQTLFAYNSWDIGGNDDLGIGNQPSGNPDWTFAANTGSYTTRRLYILINAGCLAPTATINTNAGNSCEITIPNYASILTPTDNCTPSGSIVEAQTIPAGAYTTGVSDGAVITVNYTATDQSSNTATCTVAITVNDDDAPSVTCPATTAAIPVNAGSPCTIAIPDYVNLLSPTDNCTSSGSIVEVQSIPAGNYAVSGNGATVVVNYTATDGASPANTTTCTVTITASAAEADVQGNNTSITDGDNTPAASDHTDFGQSTGSPITRTFTIYNTGSQNLTLDAGSITVSGANASMFAVSNVTLSASVSGPGGTLSFNVTYMPGMVSGIHTATVNIVNSDCNESTYDFAIKAELTCTSPSFTACPASPLTANTAAGLCTAAVSYTVTATGTPAPTLSYAFTGATTGSGSGTGSGATFNKGNTAVTVTATNTCGTATCSFTVTVTDNEQAAILCPTDIVVANIANTCSSVPVIYTTPVGTDNCTPSTNQTAGLASGSVFPYGVTTNTFEVSDGVNPNSSCSFTVEVTGANGLPINNTDQSEGYCTLAAAVADANAGEHITAVAGTYTGCVNVDRDVRFEASGGPVVIDCLIMNGAGKTLTLDSDLTITTLTLTNGRIRTNGFKLTVGTATSGSAASYIVTD